MKTSLILLLASLVISQSSIAQKLWQINKDTVYTWYYDDGDEFNAKTVNTDKWKYWYGWTRSIFSQGEQEYYTDGLNHELKDGCLLLSAKKENIDARMVDWQSDT